jgi:hypothetical protein
VSVLLRKPTIPRRIAVKVRTQITAGKGLGDRVYDFTHMTGLNKVAELYSDVTGCDCGCEKRRQALNNLVPNL